MSAPFREALVDLGAITENVRALRASVATSTVMAVVKADGYGHGAIPAAHAALDGGANWLGVADIAEALRLRDAGITAPLLAWLHAPGADFASAIEAGIDLGVSSAAQLEEVAAAGPAAVQLKLDTGLGRNGIQSDDAEAVFRRAADLQHLGRIRVRGLFSHLSNASVDDDTAQLAVFEQQLAAARAAGLDPEFTHLAATAGALSLPAARLGMVRLGLGIYGLSPFTDTTSTALGLRPAMRLSAVVASVKRVPAGQGVSYGYTFRTAAPTTLALVPLGYADGVPRHASNRAPVSINGRTYRIAGRVAMDQFVVDVGDAPVSVGDAAVLFGDPAEGVPSADDWAAACDTINYEIVTRIGARVTRSYRS
ncbi:alanine racemase [Salinibacterium sp. ZJ450]|uniref:alanine racemase n=1 Tax=Salinibacterium sp. ZJ450 TaxID=2708338 RepID=UPI0014203650|nr:alanine racemase [Salinibacterium sp. ZJ450]